ncbi:MAG: hypothetical protein MUP86_00210 [Dehalococcoidia bacterium]|nr:hypothetical protein [Dehalococcoidia bacterium]
MATALKSKGKNKGHENLKPWPKGVSGNPKGRPPLGKSWAETIRQVGEMTPADAAKKCFAIAGQMQSLGDKLTLREAVVMRVFSQLLFEPQGGLFNAVMDRVEGKVPQPVDMTMTWRDELRRLGYDPDAIQSEAVRQFASIVASHSAGVAESRDGGGVDGGEA